MWWIAAIGCQSTPAPDPETQTFVTMCDGCSSSSSTPPGGQVTLRALSDAGTSIVGRWSGAGGEGFGAALASAGDLDGDGLLDVRVGTEGGDVVLLAGAVPEARHAQLDAPARPIGDLDGDTLPEFTLTIGDVTAWLTGDTLAAPGTYGLRDGLTLDAPGLGGPAPDLDGDGTPESGWALGGATVQTFVWRPGVDFASELARFDVPGTASAGPWALGDVDGDGVGEVAFTTYDAAEGALHVWSGAALAAGERAELSVVHAPGYPRFDVRDLGDADADGVDDALVAVLGGASEEVRLVFGGGWPTVGAFDTLGVGLGGVGAVAGVDVADANGDGAVEVALLGRSGAVAVFDGVELADGPEARWQSTALGAQVLLAGTAPDGALLLWASDPGGLAR